MRQKKWFPIGYMFVATAFFSTIIIGFAEATRARVEANEKLAFEQAVLTVLPDLYNPAMNYLTTNRCLSKIQTL